jgi:putative hydrolase of the HAD superfamily
VAKSLSQFRYMTFDVVGTLIDFEAGLKASLAGIAADAGVALDGEEALALYRAARYMDEALKFPDDLPRCYRVIAPKLGLPPRDDYAARMRADVAHWRAFPDSRDALARLKTRAKLIAMTNAQRWAFELFSKELGDPFYAAFTVDDTGTEKPDPAFFEQVIAFVEKDGGAKEQILHVAQSQYHDIGVSRELGLTNCWIERRHAQPGYGGTIEPERFTKPDFHFTSMAQLADAAAADAAV